MYIISSIKHKSFIGLEILLISFKMSLQVLYPLFNHSLIVWQHHSRILQWQRCLILITNFDALFIHDPQKVFIFIKSFFLLVSHHIIEQHLSTTSSRYILCHISLISASFASVWVSKRVLVIEFPPIPASITLTWLQLIVWWLPILYSIGPMMHHPKMVWNV